MDIKSPMKNAKTIQNQFASASLPLLEAGRQLQMASGAHSLHDKSPKFPHTEEIMCVELCQQ